MKKGWKIFWIVCSSVFGVGVVLCIAGFAVGVSNGDVRTAFRNGFGRFGIHVDKAVTDYDSHTEMIVEEIEDEGEVFHDIRNLEIEVTKVEFRIVETDENAFRIEKAIEEEVGRYLQIYQEGSTLKVEMEDERRFHKGYDNAGTITLYVPRGATFEQAEFSVGAGALDIGALRARELELEVGAGSVTAGRIETNDISMTCGMGSIEMTAAGCQEDYNYELEVGMGSVSLGGSEFGGMALERNINNNAAKHMEIECGMGSIQIGYEQ